MSKVLYVRGFNEKLHSELDDQARKEGISPASILENAFEEWLKNKKEIPTKHYLVLYSDDKSLLNFIRKVNDLDDDGWMHVTCGSQYHIGVKFLKKHGWFDATISPYTQGMKRPEKYASKVFDHLRKIANGKQTCFIGFMTEDIAHNHSLHKANDIEKIYKTKKIGGIVFCPYDMRKLKSFDFTEIFKLFENHDEIFVLKESDIYKLNVDKTNHAKLFL
ncbi:MAG: hypothetical protein QQN61_03555 [Nitrosopumilus sp.]